MPRYIFLVSTCFHTGPACLARSIDRRTYVYSTLTSVHMYVRTNINRRIREARRIHLYALTTYMSYTSELGIMGGLFTSYTTQFLTRRKVRRHCGLPCRRYRSLRRRTFTVRQRYCPLVHPTPGSLQDRSSLRVARAPYRWTHSSLFLPKTILKQISTERPSTISFRVTQDNLTYMASILF